VNLLQHHSLKANTMGLPSPKNSYSSYNPVTHTGGDAVLSTAVQREGCTTACGSAQALSTSAQSHVVNMTELLPNMICMLISLPVLTTHSTNCCTQPWDIAQIVLQDDSVVCQITTLFVCP
jgi:hypothetical protein